MMSAPEMNNVLFYTLSTIAQTLAGTLAIVLAIVLYGFNKLSDTIPRASGGTKVRAAKVRPRLWWAITISLIDIGFCFAALPFTSFIAPCTVFARGVLIASVGAGVICLWFYWWVITSMIKILIWPGST